MNSVERQCMECGKIVEIFYNDESDNLHKAKCDYCGNYILVSGEQESDIGDFVLSCFANDPVELASLYGCGLTKKQYDNAFKFLDAGIKIELHFDDDGNVIGVKLA